MNESGVPSKNHTEHGGSSTVTMNANDTAAETNETVDAARYYKLLKHFGEISKENNRLEREKYESEKEVGDLQGTLTGMLEMMQMQQLRLEQCARTYESNYQDDGSECGDFPIGLNSIRQSVGSADLNAKLQEVDALEALVTQMEMAEGEAQNALRIEAAVKWEKVNTLLQCSTSPTRMLEKLRLSGTSILAANANAMRNSAAPRLGSTRPVRANSQADAPPRDIAVPTTSCARPKATSLEDACIRRSQSSSSQSPRSVALSEAAKLIADAEQHIAFLEERLEEQNKDNNNDELVISLRAAKAELEQKMAEEKAQATEYASKLEMESDFFRQQLMTHITKKAPLFIEGSPIAAKPVVQDAPPTLGAAKDSRNLPIQDAPPTHNAATDAQSQSTAASPNGAPCGCARQTTATITVSDEVKPAQTVRAIIRLPKSMTLPHVRVGPQVEVVTFDNTGNAGPSRHQGTLNVSQSQGPIRLTGRGVDVEMTRSTLLSTAPAPARSSMYSDEGGMDDIIEAPTVQAIYTSKGDGHIASRDPTGVADIAKGPLMSSSKAFGTYLSEDKGSKDRMPSPQGLSLLPSCSTLRDDKPNKTEIIDTDLMYEDAS